MEPKLDTNLLEAGQNVRPRMESKLARTCYFGWSQGWIETYSQMDRAYYFGWSQSWIETCLKLDRTYPNLGENAPKA